jgi:selenium-binding protein 1
MRISKRPVWREASVRGGKGEAAVSVRERRMAFEPLLSRTGRTAKLAIRIYCTLQKALGADHANRAEIKMAKNGGSHCCGPGYASPAEAMKAPREKILYTVALYIGTGIQKPDYLATIDADPRAHLQPGHRPAGNAGHRRRAASHGLERLLVVPSRSDQATALPDRARCPLVEPAHRRLRRRPEGAAPSQGDQGAEIKARTNLSAPHTVHCLGSDIIISMLGDARGNAPGGFLHLNENFEIVGRWENDLGGMKFNYDFWYQPRHNVMVSSEWAAPNTFMPGFDLEEVGQLKYGREIHFWDFKNKRVEKTMYLGEDGLVPLEVRFHHDPDSSHGFVGAALSSNIIHWCKRDGEWIWEKIIDVENVRHPEWPIPCRASSA